LTVHRVHVFVAAALIATDLVACVDLTPPPSTDGALVSMDARNDPPAADVDATGGGGGASGGGGGGGGGMVDGGGGAAGGSVDAAVDMGPPSSLAMGLVGYWKLDSKSGALGNIALDSSGMSNDGAIVGAPTLVTSGLPALAFPDPGAYGFLAQTDAVTVPDAASLRPPQISIAVWLKLASQNARQICGGASQQMQYVVHRRNPRGAQGMFEGVTLMKEAAGTFGFLLSTGAGQQDTAHSTTRPAVGNWYHVAATFDGTAGGAHQMVLYVNGVAEATVSHNSSISYDPTRPLFIARTGECGGAGEATWDAFFNGTLDDLRIYDRVLTAQEVISLAGGSD
jgi:hypothetical protein